MSDWGHSLIVHPYADDTMISESQTFSEISQESHWSDDGKKNLTEILQKRSLLATVITALLLAVFQTRKESLFAAQS